MTTLGAYRSLRNDGAMSAKPPPMYECIESTYTYDNLVSHDHIGYGAYEYAVSSMPLSMTLLHYGGDITPSDGRHHCYCSVIGM